MAPSNSGNDFRTIVTVASSFSVGVATAFLFSVQQINPSLKIKLTIATFVSFIAAFALTFGFCRSVFQPTPTRNSQANPRVWTILFAVLAAVGITTAFVFGIKDLSTSKLIDVISGIALAGLVLTVIGLVFMKVVRFLNADEKHNTITAEDLRHPHHKLPGDANQSPSEDADPKA